MYTFMYEKYTVMIFMTFSQSFMGDPTRKTDFSIELIPYIK